MRNSTISIMVALMATWALPTAMMAQSIDLPPDTGSGYSRGHDRDSNRIETRPVELAEIRIRENNWSQAFSDQAMTFIIAGIAERAGILIGMSVTELLEEVEERDALTSQRASRWVNQRSPRLQEQTLEPATIRFELVFGGSADSRTQDIWVGNNSVALESGRSTATVHLIIRDMVSGAVITTLQARGERRSTNVDFLQIARRWDWRGWGIDLGSSDDPAWRRGILAIDACLQDFDRVLRRELGRIRANLHGER